MYGIPAMIMYACTALAGRNCVRMIGGRSSAPALARGDGTPTPSSSSSRVASGPSPSRRGASAAAPVAPSPSMLVSAGAAAICGARAVAERRRSVLWAGHSARAGD